MFTFRGSGYLYRFEWYYVFNLLIAGMVMLGSAKTIASTYALYLSPDAELIKRRSREPIKIEGRIAQSTHHGPPTAYGLLVACVHPCAKGLPAPTHRSAFVYVRAVGINAIMNVQAFEALDADNDGSLDVTEIVTRLAPIPGITFEQALAIATIIVKSADKNERPTKKRNSQVAPHVSMRSMVKNQAVEFGEFMVAADGGNMISWEKYLDEVGKSVDITKANVDHKMCEESFDRAKAAAACSVGALAQVAAPNDVLAVSHASSTKTG